mmetsp:Transcript_29366/g.72063  ORF Transcript_29366/g.72063 Transcript_29366/m.72063 type:complete len:156 (-) Transcript_29366:91-558(-)
MSRITLVKEGHPDALVLEHPAAISEGKAASLVLKSHKGLGVVAAAAPKRIKEWRVSYMQLDLGDPQKAVRVKRSGDFLVSADPVSKGFVLDVPFDKREVGTGGLAMSMVTLDNGKVQDPDAKGRLFSITPAGHVSCRETPGLVLGYRGLPIQLPE